MKNIITYIILLLIIASPQIFAGNVYYVDNKNGDDNNSGKSPETPWQTINKVNNQLFYPGDSVLFKKGEIWHERLIISSSGTDGNPISFGAYGTGLNPIINGADLFTNWTFRGSNIYSTASCGKGCGKIRNRSVA